MAKNYKVVFDEVKVLPGNSIKLLSEFGEIGAATKDGDEVKLTPYNCWDLTKLRAGDMTAEVDTRLANEYYDDNINHIGKANVTVAVPLIDYEKGDLYFDESYNWNDSEAKSFIVNAAKNSQGDLIVKNYDALNATAKQSVQTYLYSYIGSSYNGKIKFESENPLEVAGRQGTDSSNRAYVGLKSENAVSYSDKNTLYLCDCDFAEIEQNSEYSIQANTSKISKITSSKENPAPVSFYGNGGEYQVDSPRVPVSFGSSRSGKNVSIKNSNVLFSDNQYFNTVKEISDTDACFSYSGSDAELTNITLKNVNFSAKNYNERNPVGRKILIGGDVEIENVTLPVNSQILLENNLPLNIEEIKTTEAVLIYGNTEGLKRVVAKELYETEGQTYDNDFSAVSLRKNKIVQPGVYSIESKYFSNMTSSTLEAEIEAGEDTVKVAVSKSSLKIHFDEEDKEVVEFFGQYEVAPNSQYAEYYYIGTGSSLYTNALVTSDADNVYITIPTSHAQYLSRDNDYISLGVKHTIGDSLSYNQTIKFSTKVIESARIRVEEDTPADTE